MADSRRRWAIRVTDEVRQWLRGLRASDEDAYRAVNVAVDILAEVGPGLGRPLVDTLRESNVSNLKELRPAVGVGRCHSCDLRVRPVVTGGAVGRRQ